VFAVKCAAYNKGIQVGQKTVGFVRTSQIIANYLFAA